MMPGTTLPTGPDRLTLAVERALGLARTVRTTLLDSVLLHLPHLKRGAAEYIIRRIGRGRIFDETMLNDLDALIAFLEREAEAGTHHGWQADEHHVCGGWPLVHRDAPAEALTGSATELRDLRAAIASVLDAVEAERVRARLLAED